MSNVSLTNSEKIAMWESIVVGDVVGFKTLGGNPLCGKVTHVAKRTTSSGMFTFRDFEVRVGVGEELHLVDEDQIFEIC